LSGSRVAVFGGAFDPIHNAHLAVARAAADEFHLNRVLFVPAHHPPHKGGVTYAPYEDRVRMVEIACAADRRFEASRLEEGTERSYSIDTIEKLRATLAPEDELFFIIGADAFAELRTWRRWKDVARAVRFLVVSRPGYRYDVPSEVKAERLDTVDLPASSSRVRQALAASDTPDSVPEGVMQYIKARCLYSVTPRSPWQ
jgi:nicotinate-nucleotide adenylyltransferase